MLPAAFRATNAPHYHRPCHGSNVVAGVTARAVVARTVFSEQVQGFLNGVFVRITVAGIGMGGAVDSLGRAP